MLGLGTTFSKSQIGQAQKQYTYCLTLAQFQPLFEILEIPFGLVDAKWSNLGRRVSQVICLFDPPNLVTYRVDLILPTWKLKTGFRTTMVGSIVFSCLLEAPFEGPLN